MSRRLEKPAVTLKDVARAANVSFQTVSRAINGHAEISDETRDRILAVCKDLGYRPNRLAGSLRAKNSKVIGLVVSDIENAYFAEVVSGAEAECARQGYSLLLANSAEDIEKERSAVASLFDRRVDGLLLAPAEGDHDYLRGDLPSDFPIVAFNRRLDDPQCGAVLTENEQGARAAVEYFIERGHKKIGAIVASAALMTSRERLAGFKLAMDAAGLRMRQEWLATGGVRADSAFDGAVKILSRKDRPTALLTSSHRITEGVMMALRHLGLRYGQDVELVSFDNVRWAAFLDPPLPVVEQPTREIGREAVRMLIGLINGSEPATTVRLPVRFLTHAAHEAPSRSGISA